MQNKWMILVAGLATVFITLAAIIAMLEFFHRVLGMRPEKKRQVSAPLPEINTIIQKATRPLEAAPGTVETEIIAIISAAIGAESGMAPSSFRIASVQPSPEGREGFNTPVWGRIERFARK
jgi:hypothetical protein